MFNIVGYKNPCEWHVYEQETEHGAYRPLSFLFYFFGQFLFSYVCSGAASVLSGQLVCVDIRDIFAKKHTHKHIHTMNLNALRERNGFSVWLRVWIIYFSLNYRKPYTQSTKIHIERTKETHDPNLSLASTIPHLRFYLIFFLVFFFLISFKQLVVTNWKLWESLKWTNC